MIQKNKSDFQENNKDTFCPLFVNIFELTKQTMTF